VERLLKKLNFKEGTHNKLCLHNIPDEQSQLKNAFDELDQTEVIGFSALADEKSLDFALFFFQEKSELDEIIPKLIPHLKDDAVLWCCYPKKSSKKYSSDITRDTGWAVFGDFNYEPVRQVAVDDDWSALRFRSVDHIKVMTRKKSFTKRE
jgi:hypothetical protein